MAAQFSSKKFPNAKNKMHPPFDLQDNFTIKSPYI